MTGVRMHVLKREPSYFGMRPNGFHLVMVTRVSLTLYVILLADGRLAGVVSGWNWRSWLHIRKRLYSMCMVLVVVVMSSLGGLRRKSQRPSSERVFVGLCLLCNTLLCLGKQSPSARKALQVCSIV